MQDKIKTTFSNFSKILGTTAIVIVISSISGITNPAYANNTKSSIDNTKSSIEQKSSSNLQTEINNKINTRLGLFDYNNNEEEIDIYLQDGENFNDIKTKFKEIILKRILHYINKFSEVHPEFSKEKLKKILTENIKYNISNNKNEVSFSIKIGNTIYNIGSLNKEPIKPGMFDLATKNHYKSEEKLEKLSLLINSVLEVGCNYKPDIDLNKNLNKKDTMDISKPQELKRNSITNDFSKTKPSITNDFSL